jgi:hypothetical protein
MRNLLILLILLILGSCQKSQIPKQVLAYQQPKSIVQHITIFTVRDGAFEDPETWNLRVVPEHYDVCDVNHSITISGIHKVAGLKSTRGGKITALLGGCLTVSPKE